MRIALLIVNLIGFVLAAPLGAEVIYKWVDAQGQPHFSDVPRDGAEEVLISAPQSYTPVNTPARTQESSATTKPDKDDGSADGYTIFAITSPGAEETIWNTGGIIRVSLALQPALTRGHTIRLLIDGQQKQQLGPGVLSTQLSGIFRGEHQLQAQIVTPDRQVVQAATPVTFFYKQTTVSRNPAAAPRTPATPPAGS